MHSFNLTRVGNSNRYSPPQKKKLTELLCMCQSMGGVHSLEVVLGCLVLLHAAYLGPVM